MPCPARARRKWSTIPRSYLGAAVLTAGALNNKVISKNKTDDLGYGYKDGNQGYGYYFGDIKDDD
ncbi:hypothetical protein JHU04_004353 [Brenneria sp. 4F2]|nr:hypothetical protein [Brenneria bubanii]